MEKTKPLALVLGSQGALGKALVKELAFSYQVFELHRRNCDYSDQNLAQHADTLGAVGPFTRIICCIGLLHNDRVSPERSLKHIEAEVLQTYFHINSVLPMMCMKHFTPLLGTESLSVYLNLSAMVGSIGDNQLGGWYGYRSSKAALNMLVKTTAVEVSRKNKNAVVVAIHPGTTRSPMSAPFSRNIKPDKYYPPEVSAQRILKVANGLTASDTGHFFNWDGNRLRW